jgi:hypothetical protein
MQDIIKVLVGVADLIIAYPLGNLIRNKTKDEQKIGKPWFLLITWMGIISGTLGLIIGKDWLLFTGFFFAVISSRSLVVKK